MKFGVREIVFVSLILAVIGWGYFFVYVPATVERRELRADIRMKNRALADLAVATVGAKELNHRAELTRQTIEQFTRHLPPERDAIQIVRDLSKGAVQNELTLHSIESLPIERLAIYSQQPIRMSLSGDCAAVYQFLQQMERGSNALRVTQMSLHKAKRDGDVTAELTICAYFAPALHVTQTATTN
jgi:Tfp pilus assembly protein PilO